MTAFVASWTLAAAVALGQLGAADAQTGVLRIEVTLVDADLKLRPVPRHVLRLTGGPLNESIDAVTGSDGRVEVPLRTGTYELASAHAVEFQGRSYRWSRGLTISPGVVTSLELSVDSAIIEERVAPTARLPELFREWRDSVVTVWSETGHGTGFVIDARGLILTCEHVLGRNDYAAVQLTPTLKVPAVVVGRYPAKDVALLRVHPQHVAGLPPVRIWESPDGHAPIAEGQPVFTIGSPLNLQRVMTSGIVSKVDAAVLLTDIALAEGNSGGPLFTLDGVAVGITAFRAAGGDGASRISGAMRIDQLSEEIAAARTALEGEPPAADPLPVEPAQPFPIAALASRLEARPVRPEDYQFSSSAFSVTVITPVLIYGVDTEARKAAARARTKRQSPADDQSVSPSPFSDFKDWAAYIGGFRSVLIIDIRPKLTEGFWAGFGRSFGGQARMRFRADFRSMKLLCGSREVAPIHPGRVEHVVNVNSDALQITDQTAEGLYVFGPDAIGPQCGTVTLAVFTDEQPDRPEQTLLSAQLVNRVWDDFAPYRAVVTGAARE